MVEEYLLHKSKYVAQKLFDSKENYVTCFWQNKKTNILELLSNHLLSFS